MRGASALQGVFEKRPDAKLKVLIVWLPVVATDVAPPTKRVLGRLKDTRATQFWDEKRLTSDAIFQAVAENPKWMKPGETELCWGPEGRLGFRRRVPRRRAMGKDDPAAGLLRLPRGRGDRRTRKEAECWRELKGSRLTVTGSS